jgi:two-component sensor histidine kinase/PAS domain-containing protein
MSVKVIYKNDMPAEIEPSLLDELLSPNLIKKFLRSDGWVTVGIDPIRSLQATGYSGMERRGFKGQVILNEANSTKEVCFWNKNRYFVSSCDFQELFESAPGLMLVIDNKLKIMAASDEYLKATMTKREDILGHDMFEVFPDNPDDPFATGVKNLGTSFKRVLKNKRPDIMPIQKYDIREPAEQGGKFKVRYWSPVNSPIFGIDHEIKYIIHRIEDVTEYIDLKLKGIEIDQKNRELTRHLVRAEAEVYSKTMEIAEINKQLKQLLDERDLIIKEVYHRVKNNMSTMSSLLNIQSLHVNDEKAKDALHESSSRIKAMQIIYDKLIYSSDFLHIDLKGYLSNLIVSIFDSYGAKSGKVKLNIDIDSYVTDTKTATTCGIIINELLTNSMKYAFPGDMEGIIKITLTAAGNKINLVIHDSGIGIPQERGGGFGMYLVSSLVKQLGGDMEIKRGNGTEFNISFNKVKHNIEKSEAA